MTNNENLALKVRNKMNNEIGLYGKACYWQAYYTCMGNKKSLAEYNAQVLSHATAYRMLAEILGIKSTPISKDLSEISVKMAKKGHAAGEIDRQNRTEKRAAKKAAPKMDNVPSKGKNYRKA